MSGSLVLRSGVGTQMLMVSSSRDDGEVSGGVEASGLHELGNFAAGNVLDVGLAAHEAVDARLLQVDAGDVETGLGEFHCQGQADIAEPDDAYAGGFRFDLLFECLKGAHGCLHCRHNGVSNHAETAGHRPAVTNL